MSDTLSRASGIVFDLDGTLVDSTYIHTLCWWQAMQQFGHERPMAAIHHAVGMGADHLLDHVLDPGRYIGQDDAITKAHDMSVNVHIKTKLIAQFTGTVSKRANRISLMTT